MKHLKLTEGFGYFGEFAPSKSFIKKLSHSITEQIENIIELPNYKKIFTDIIELSFEKHNSLYDISHPDKILMNIEAKSAPLVICHFCVTFIPISNVKDYNVYPWADVSNIDIEFKMIIQPYEVKKLNRILPELYTPTVSMSESGLPYEYQLKSLSTDGNLIFLLKTDADEAKKVAINTVLNDFFAAYNNDNEIKIHYVGDMQIKRNNKISVSIDFGASHSIAIEKCIYSFAECNFIKKIVYQ